MPSKATTYTVTVVKAQTQPYSMLLKSWQECILPCPPHTHCVCLFLVIFVTVVVLPHSYSMGFLLYRWQDSICRDSGRLHPLLQPAIERRISGVYQEYRCFSTAVLRLCMGSEGTMLFATSADGCIFMFDARERDPLRMPRR